MSGQEEQARFGERVRRFVAPMKGLAGPLVARLQAIAAAIDQDAKTDKEALRYYILGQIEEAVESLKHVVLWTGTVNETKEAIDVEPFMAELGLIFGDRPEQVAARATPDAKRFEIPGQDGAAGLRLAINPDGETLFWPIDRSVGQGFALSSVAARDLALLLATQLPDGPFSISLAIPSEGVRPITGMESVLDQAGDVHPDERPIRGQR